MSWSGCTTYKLVSADQAETFLKQGEAFEVPADGVYMNEARYQRYRRAVADKIEAAQKPAARSLEQHEVPTPQGLE